MASLKFDKKKKIQEAFPHFTFMRSILTVETGMFISKDRRITSVNVEIDNIYSIQP